MNRSVLLFIVISNTGFTQNWTVFNKQYRYNYKFDNSNLISHVIFQDSVKKVGNDSIYFLNRIAAPCNGNCKGLGGVLSPTQNVIVANMPQFLQKKVIKKGNGDVLLDDTTQLLIKPSCVLNESWIFDSDYNYTATCIAVTIQSIFGITDSIKRIVINNSDTLILSKSFGIISFPQIYGKNKFYKLAGIEKRYSYDTTALYGEKVPNAWDFYDFDVGDVFCRMKESKAFKGGGGDGDFTCENYQVTISGKTVTATGYLYMANSYYSSDFQMVSYLLNCNRSPQYYSGPMNYAILNKDSLLENRMYPGMLVPKSYAKSAGGGLSVWAANTVTFGKDVAGKFYKVVGVSLCGGPYPGIPSGKYWGLVSDGPPTQGFQFYKTTGADRFYLQFGEGLGMVSTGYQAFELNGSNCYRCLKKNGIDIFGLPFVGINDNEISDARLRIFPNPVANMLTVKIFEKGEIKIYSILGQLLYASIHNNESKIDVKDFENGMYTLVIKTPTGQLTKKIVVEH